MKKFLAVTFLMIAYASFSFSQTNAQATLQKKIEVTGSAEMEVVPDEIYIGVTLKEYYDNQKTKMDINTISKEFLARCEKAGITKDRIEVQNMSGFDGTPWWKQRNKKQPDLMQSTSYILKFSSPADVDKLTSLLDDNSTQNVYISKVSNSKQAEYRRQLKIQALQNAKAKAQYLLESIGEKTGGVLFVKEVEQGDYNPRYERAMMSNAMMADDSGSANEGLNFKKIKYRFEVEAHFAIQ